MDLLESTNDGRFILADFKLNNGCLSDKGQNTLTKLLINFIFQDQSMYAMCCMRINVFTITE
jgi:hypothetical protein